MIRQILEAAQVSKQACAALLGVSEGVFDAWVADQQPIPDGYAQSLSAMLGVDPEELRHARSRTMRAEHTPPVWFKLRDARITPRDRECVALVRRFAFLYDQFEDAMSRPSIVWSTLFEAIRRDADQQAPPGEQGRRAARAFRAARGLDSGARGIGEVFRGNLRAAGILVLETPIPNSTIEGFCFYVRTGEKRERPCVVANTHGTTWFRRNSLLLHEVAHAIFDAPSAGAAVDYSGEGVEEDVAEIRAQAFAQELLAPSEVIQHVTQANAIRWDSLTAKDLALLIAETQAEQRMVVSAAVCAGLLEQDAAAHANALDVTAELQKISEHAATSAKYFARHPEHAGFIEKRTTATGTTQLRLPLGYVARVIDAVKDASISWTKGAELLMVDRETFSQRFPDCIEAE